LEWIVTYERNPNLLTELVNLLGGNVTNSLGIQNEFENALVIARRTIDLLKNLREERLDFDKAMERKQELEKEKYVKR